MGLKQIRFLNLLGVFLLSGLLLTACGESEPLASNNINTVATVPEATPTNELKVTPTTTVAVVQNTNTVVPALNTATALPSTKKISNTPTPKPTVAEPTVTPKPTTESVPTVKLNTQAATAVAPLANTPLPSGLDGVITGAYVYYLKDGAIWATRKDGGDKHSLAENVQSAIRYGENNLIYIQSTGGKASQLKWMRVTAGASVQETVLDNAVFAGTLSYQVLSSALAVAPDGASVAYLKSNQSASGFDLIGGGQAYPTELWVAILDAKNPTTRKLAPNDKDFTFQPLWSPDGSRIAFARAQNFGTGAGYATSLWSVHKDGTHLAHLTGPDLGKIDGQSFNANPAYNLHWINNLALGFQASNQMLSPLWLHDLTGNSDFPKLITAEAGYQSVYCGATTQRYVFVKENRNTGEKSGVFAVEANKAGATPVVLDPTATAVLACAGNLVVYQDSEHGAVLQTLGAANSPKIKLGPAGNPNTEMRASFSPDGKYFALALNTDGTDKPARGLEIYRADGSAVKLAGDVKAFGNSLAWIGSSVATMITNGNDHSENLVIVDLGSANPTVKVADDTKSFINIIEMAK